METYNKTFSIIVPVYNVAKYVDKCLKSLLSQKNDDFEVICIDDASTDDSLNIIKKYLPDNRLKVVENEANKGLSYSRNRGLNFATGEYILFVDSDDYVSDDTFEVLTQIIEEFPEADFINFQMHRVFEKEFSKQEVAYFESNYSIFYENTSAEEWFCDAVESKGLIIGVWSRVYKHSFLKTNNILFDEGILYGDQPFLIKCVFHAKYTVSIPNRLYAYRMRSGSIMQKTVEKELDSRIVALNEIMHIWRSRAWSIRFDNALCEYLSENIVNRLNYLLDYFPDRSINECGDAADSFLLGLFRNIKKGIEKKYICISDEEINLIRRYDKVICYGAGRVCLELLATLGENKIDVMTVAVTQKNEEQNIIGGVSISQIDDLLEYHNSALVIISTKNSQKNIESHLRELDFNNILLLDCLQ